ncbi:MAG: hypothetical protein MAG795_00790 [Candidatus Woesearchaeota archaeon]|nr:hypothetical protein [Candidatus Woesearchaeota archaeon]
MISLQLSYQEAYTILQPLVIYVIGIALYAIFIFHFYKFLAKRDVINFDLNKYNEAQQPFFKKLLRVIFYLIQYILLVPILTFIWFGVLLTLLTFLSEQLIIQNLILSSMAVVAAIRISAYYNENLSVDLAKLLPLALLGVYIVDSTFVSFAESWDTLMKVPSHWRMLLYYFLLAMGLEIIMRIVYLIISSVSSEKDVRLRQ